MRPVHLTDLNIVVRTLLACPDDERVEVMRTIRNAAQVADKYQKKTGLSHREFGSGRLADACRSREKVPMPDHCTAEYLHALGTVVACLVSQNHQNP